MTDTIQDKCDAECSGTDSNLEGTLLENQTAEGLAEIFKAIGDPTRVKIIYALLNKELCVHDITEILNMQQSAISHQLRYLRNLHIVKRRKEGKTVYYSLDDQHIEEIFKITLQHLKHV